MPGRKSRGTSYRIKGGVADELQPARVLAEPLADGSWHLSSSGDWTAESLDQAVIDLKRFAKKQSKSGLQWDFSAVSQMDSAGLMLFLHYRKLLESSHPSVAISGQSHKQLQLHQLLHDFLPEQPAKRPPLRLRLLEPLNHLGTATVKSWYTLLDFLSFIGNNFIVLLYLLQHPGSIRFDAIAKNIQDAGIRALPIVTLTSFLTVSYTHLTLPTKA